MTTAQLRYGKRMAEPGVRAQTQKVGWREKRREAGRIEREGQRGSQPAAARDLTAEVAAAI